MIGMLAGIIAPGVVVLRAQVLVTLSPAASPTAGQAGVTSISVTGSGFPTATIPPANTDVKLEPGAGGSAVSTKATAVTTIVGTTRRVNFMIPATIVVTRSGFPDGFPVFVLTARQ